MSFVETTLDLVKTHQEWAVPIVFLLAFGESLAGAEIEGHSRPAPVGDLGLERHEGLGLGGGGAQLLEIALHRAAIGGTGQVIVTPGQTNNVIKETTVELRVVK